MHDIIIEDWKTAIPVTRRAGLSRLYLLLLIIRRKEMKRGNEVAFCNNTIKSIFYYHPL